MLLFQKYNHHNNWTKRIQYFFNWFKGIFFLIINFKKTVSWVEYQAERKLAKDLRPNLIYLSKVYETCFACTKILENKTRSEINNYALIAQLMLIMRMNDFLRTIILIARKGYPDQVGTLVASIFELSHTSVYLSYNPDAVTLWYGIDKFSGKMPDLIGVKGGYQQLVKANYNHLNLSHYSDEDYKLYRELCLMKHSHPKTHSLRKTEKNLLFQTGPYTDHKCINNTCVCTMQAGRLIAMAIDIALTSTQLSQDFPYLQNMLDDISKMRSDLTKRIEGGLK